MVQNAKCYRITRQENPEFLGEFDGGAKTPSNSGVISFEYREIWERYARYVSSLTNKQTNKQTNQTSKMNEISGDRRPKQRGKNLKFALHRYIARKEGEKERKKSGVISVNLSGFQQIQVQEKWIKNRPNQRGEIRNLSFEYREREGKNWREIEGFPANPSQILPTFCHGNEVKPWKFQKDLLKISFVCPKVKRKKIKINWETV